MYFEIFSLLLFLFTYALCVKSIYLLQIWRYKFEILLHLLLHLNIFNCMYGFFNYQIHFIFKNAGCECRRARINYKMCSRVDCPLPEKYIFTPSMCSRVDWRSLYVSGTHECALPGIWKKLVFDFGWPSFFETYNVLSGRHFETTKYQGHPCHICMHFSNMKIYITLQHSCTVDRVPHVLMTHNVLSGRPAACPLPCTHQCALG